MRLCPCKPESGLSFDDGLLVLLNCVIWNVLYNLENLVNTCTIKNFAFDRC